MREGIGFEIAASNRYNRSIDVTMMPRRVASALKLARPSAHPTILTCRSASLRANMRRHFSKDRPHGNYLIECEHRLLNNLYSRKSAAMVICAARGHKVAGFLHLAYLSRAIADGRLHAHEQCQFTPLAVAAHIHQANLAQPRELRFNIKQLARWIPVSTGNGLQAGESATD